MAGSYFQLFFLRSIFCMSAAASCLASRCLRRNQMAVSGSRTGCARVSKRLAYVTLASLGVSWLVACGGGGDSGPPISVAFAPPLPTSVPVGKTASLSATVANDGSNSGVSWSVTCNSSSCGSFDPTQTASDAPTTYTPPATVPSGGTVTITATSVADGTRSASGTVTITASTTPVLADGIYVFHVSGVDQSQGPYSIAGAFKVSGGLITGGEEDFTDLTSGDYFAINAQASSLSTSGSDVQIALQAVPDTTPGAPVIGDNGLITIRGALVSTTRALISEHDDWATATGSLDLQTAGGAPQGAYAFAVQGSDTNSGTALVAGGILDFSGGSLVTSSSVLDLNDGGTATTGQAFSSGTVGAADAYGRVIIALVPASTAGMTFSAYSVSAARLYLIEDQADAANANLGGTALGQGTNAGSFTTASVAGASYAFGVAGLDNTAPSGSAVTIAGGFGLNANGTVSGAVAFADSTVHQGNTISGSWSVASNGRVTLNPVNFPSTGVTLAFQMYLDGNGNALVLSVDSFEITEGPGFAQTATQTALSGPYGMTVLGLNPTSGTYSAVGPVTVTAGAFSGSVDLNNNGSPMSAVPVSGSQLTTNGTFSLTGLNPEDASASTSWGYYPIDNSRTLAIEVDGSQLGLMFLEASTLN
jgi:hypothetical protein